MKYILIVLAVLALLSGALAQVEHMRAEAAEEATQQAQEHARIAESALTKANEAAALLRATSLQRQQELNRLRSELEVKQKALNEALKANPDWAAAPVPASVLDALTGPAVATGPARPGVDSPSPRARPARP